MLRYGNSKEPVLWDLLFQSQVIMVWRSRWICLSSHCFETSIPITHLKVFFRNSLCIQFWRLWNPHRFHSVQIYLTFILSSHWSYLHPYPDFDAIHSCDNFFFLFTGKAVCWFINCFQLYLIFTWIFRGWLYSRLCLAASWDITS